MNKRQSESLTRLILRLLRSILSFTTGGALFRSFPYGFDSHFLPSSPLYFYQTDLSTTTKKNKGSTNAIWFHCPYLFRLAQPELLGLSCPTGTTRIVFPDLLPMGPLLYNSSVNDYCYGSRAHVWYLYSWPVPCSLLSANSIRLIQLHSSPTCQLQTNSFREPRLPVSRGERSIVASRVQWNGRSELTSVVSVCTNWTWNHPNM